MHNRGRYRLTAERETGSQMIGSFSEAWIARDVVFSRESDDVWPEGHEAVLEDTMTGRRWMLVGDWEEIH